MNRQLVDISAAIDAVRRIPPRAAVARAFARLRRDELAGSLAVAGIALERPHLDALLDRGLCTGEYPFAHLVAARDLAAAGSWIAEQRSLETGDPRPLITVEDVRRLHALATASQPEFRPGVWRLRVEPSAGGIVSLPPWLIAKETTALVDRFRRRPAAADVPAWIAAFLGRFARIRPFGAANGRAGRLAASLLLRRLDLVPPAIAPERASLYSAAIVAAESGEAEPLRAFVTHALLQGCRRLIAAAGDEPLVPLRSLAGARYPALIKAAKRGRLAVVERDGRVYTTSAWIDDYRSKSD
jgi:Fic family protein